MPQRYLRLHAAEEIIQHVEMASQLRANTVQTQLKRLRGDFSLTVITQDRPALFATLAGVLAGWGMNILKADAFSNDSGVVVDSFVFTDHFHTLEMNVQEWERFKKSFNDVLNGAVPLEKLARKRAASGGKSPKVKVETNINFDQRIRRATAPSSRLWRRIVPACCIALPPSLPSAAATSRSR